jgi:hypothetical protein
MEKPRRLLAIGRAVLWHILHRLPDCGDPCLALILCDR